MELRASSSLLLNSPTTYALMRGVLYMVRKHCILVGGHLFSRAPRAPVPPQILWLRPPAASRVTQH